MRQSKAEDLWHQLFGFKKGDRVKYKVYGRKSWVYGDIEAVKTGSYKEGAFAIIRLDDCISVWNFCRDLILVKRRKFNGRR